MYISEACKEKCKFKRVLKYKLKTNFCIWWCKCFVKLVNLHVLVFCLYLLTYDLMQLLLNLNSCRYDISSTFQWLQVQQILHFQSTKILQQKMSNLCSAPLNKCSTALVCMFNFFCFLIDCVPLIDVEYWVPLCDNSNNKM